MAEKEYEIRAEIKVKLTKQDIEDIMVCALEGGIGYWAILDNTGPAYENAPDDEPVSITCSNELLAGNEIRFEDTEEDVEYILTLEKLLTGFRKWIEAGGDEYGAVEADGSVDCCRIDAPTADEIVQYALFGEVVFG